MNLVVSREDKSPFLNSWSYRFHFIIVNYWILNMFKGFFVFYIKTFRADFLMLIKFFNETTVIMYRRESSRRKETKKLFIKLAAYGYRELIGSGTFSSYFIPTIGLISWQLKYPLDMGAHGRIWNWLRDEIATKRERHKTLKMTTAQVVETTVTVNKFYSGLGSRGRSCSTYLRNDTN